MSILSVLGLGKKEIEDTKQIELPLGRKRKTYKFDCKYKFLEKVYWYKDIGDRRVAYKGEALTLYITPQKRYILKTEEFIPRENLNKFGNTSDKFEDLVYSVDYQGYISSSSTYAYNDCEELLEHFFKICRTSSTKHLPNGYRELISKIDCKLSEQLEKILILKIQKEKNKVF
ncbi:MAG: hypothetical protein HQK79_14355 [Desulfobacterales bacterium]|nr:hypothetical protein [Desulfobacterales bacterium]MBF0396319.1 hypothetical protein [Desulfobacterales bacterium]